MQDNNRPIIIRNYMDQVRIIAEFENSRKANHARTMIAKLLDKAHLELVELMATHNGIVSSIDVAQIFRKHGLGDIIDWEPDCSPFLMGKELIWDVPLSFDLEDAFAILSSYGATDMVVQEHLSEAWRQAPHPMELTMDEEDDLEFSEFDLPDAPYTEFTSKKTLH